MMELITRHLVKAFDIGVNDNLYGGRMLDWIDEAGAMFARLSFPKNQFVTLKIAETVFHKPIHINEIIEFYVSQVTVGETSLTFTIEVKRNEELILHTTVVFVAVGIDGHSTKILKND